ncbi:LysR family transcriptional regulator [Aquirhabdus parva]|uniref:LysR family transcriptional regulator n=1 Tax=Aquirhabdus parva TaxID=2283318 RepID=A0A345P9I1_9GAMM|nr:LysR family transcriptional regulator [Aquirhabdus parva]AXI03940.1 LysR family transcriptional regulator [Aquirhabdus parva]
MKESEIDLNGIRVLLAVVQAGGFSAAARRLGVPTNRLSRQVQRLEETLGVRLLQRTTRKLSLTTVGRTLLDRAEPAMQELESWWLQTEAQAEEPRGHLRVTAPIDFMSTRTSQLLARFLETYPMITLEVVLSDDQIDLFSTGIDVAFRAGPIHDENVVARRLISSHLHVVASPSFVETYGLPEHVDALTNYPCLALRSKEGWAVWPLTGPEGQTLIHVHARLTVNGMGALVEGARAGIGMALVPDHLISDDLAAGRLINLIPTYYHDGGGIYMVYSSHKHPPAALRLFIDFIFNDAESTAKQ